MVKFIFKHNSQLKHSFFQMTLLMYIIIFLMMLFNFFSLLSTTFTTLWIFMEINSILMTSLIILSSKNWNLTFKFYLIQFIASMFMILAFFNNDIILVDQDGYLIKLNDFVIVLSILLKIGIFPFNWWPPKIMYLLPWNIILIYSTIQKFIPLIVLVNSNIVMTHPMIFALVMIHMVISAIFMVKQNNLKKLMLHSSLINLSWLIIINLINLTLFIMCFSMYFLCMLSIIMILAQFDINQFSDLEIFFKNDSKKLLYLMIMIMTLMMIPPFLTFNLKFSIFNQYLNMESWMIMSFLLLFSALIMFSYIKIIKKIFIYQKTMFKPKSYPIKKIYQPAPMYLYILPVMILTSLFILLWYFFY
uniref:NADH-ubiquinone oxidoreductase chain 2 n=1 Tax=Abispa ephippium TaxID=485912 RepID=B6RQX9_9HYME|nr:NADH dehydrogenase subunit 2 [Abispa ephippium]